MLQRVFYEYPLERYDHLKDADLVEKIAIFSFVAVIMLFGAVGGSMLPAEFMPAWMKPLQAISPVYWTLEGYLGLMQGDPLGSVVPYVAILLVMGVALTAFGVWRLRYE
jgi:ABC-type multidrug transport system permease subunit